MDRSQAEICLNQNDEERCYDLNLTFIKNRHQQITGKLLVLRDITDHKRTEKALAVTNQQLQEEILEREQLITDLNAFAHTVAHDLKSPLSVIVSSSQSLVDGTISLDESAAPIAAGLIYRTSRKSIRIIDELLTLASISRQEIQPEPLDMAAIINEVEIRLSPMIEEYKVQIIKPDVWPVAAGHAPWIEEVWANYLSNGIKYGGQPPRLELGADEQPDGSITFWVRDNGEGLSSEFQAKLFKEYSRLTEARAKGQGLGLSIVKRIVEKLGGQVSVHSENRPGHGCVFAFTLPPAHAIATPKNPEN